MTNFTVVLDSCVLYPAPLRDLLMHLALSDLYRAKWTNQIPEEWIRSVLANRSDLTLKQLERTRDLMNAHVRDCLIEGYEKLIPKIELPDQNDCHVMAAAVCASAAVIVRYNLKDFPKNILGKYEIEAQHPDKFISSLIGLAPDVVCAAVRRLRKSLKRPPINAQDYLTILEKQSLPNTVNQLKKFMETI
ncbi:MAG: PIN domain-containing protein [Gammaproteobacteria bacterium]|nr:PIN domain-containing protein [Gammaproteobacteria bacterium]